MNQFKQKGKGIQQIAASADQIRMIREEIRATQFNILFPQKLRAADFPQDKLPENWDVWALKALRFTSPLRLGIEPQEFREITDKLREDSQLNLLHFSMVSNNLEARTAKELGLDTDDYNDVMDLAGQASKAWNEITQPMRRETEDYIDSQIQVKQAAPLHPIGKFNGSPEAEDKEPDHGVLEVDLKTGESKEIGSTTEMTAENLLKTGNEVIEPAPAPKDQIQ